MDRQDILAALKQLIEPYTSSKEMLDGVNEQTDLLKDLHINSSSLIDIIIDAEEKYKIEFDPESIEKMVTVGSTIDIILEKLKEQA